jgi:hypothetical protein
MDRSTPPALYERLLGPAWETLSESLRRAHLRGERLQLHGTFRIRRGDRRLSQLVATFLRLPATGDSVATTLHVARTATGEQWVRWFGGVILTTDQSATSDGTMCERFGMIEIVCRLETAGDAIIYRQVGAALWLGGLRLRLPRFLWPKVDGIEEIDQSDMTHVSVRVVVPFIGHLISYDGCVARDEQE